MGVWVYMTLGGDVCVFVCVSEDAEKARTVAKAKFFDNSFDQVCVCVCVCGWVCT